jgi:hypothetical protein
MNVSISYVREIAGYPDFVSDVNFYPSIAMDILRKPNLMQLSISDVGVAGGDVDSMLGRMCQAASQYLEMFQIKGMYPYVFLSNAAWQPNEPLIRKKGAASRMSKAHPILNGRSEKVVEGRIGMRFVLLFQIKPEELSAALKIFCDQDSNMVGAIIFSNSNDFDGLEIYSRCFGPDPKNHRARYLPELLVLDQAVKQGRGVALFSGLSHGMPPLVSIYGSDEVWSIHHQVKVDAQPIDRARE